MDHHQIFISYSSVDADTAMAVCQSIEAAGYPCWIAPRNEQAGLSYGLQITNAIKQANVVVLLFSTSSNKSQHVLNEVGISFDQGKKIIPLMLDSSVMCEDLQYFLSRVHHIKAADNFDAGVKELVSALNQHFSSVSEDTHDKAVANVELSTRLTEILITESSNVSVATRRFSEIIKDIPDWTRQDRILNKAKEIISYSFIGVIGKEFSKIIAISKDNDAGKFDKFCLECRRMAMITLDLAIYALITHLWDAVSSDGVTLDSHDKELARKRLNVLYQLSVHEQAEMLLSLIQVYQKHADKLVLPIPELAGIVSTLEPGGDVHKACTVLAQLPEKNVTISDCIAAEDAIATVLKNFNFFMRYHMVSLKWSRYEKTRTDSTKFLHRYIALGLDNKANMDKEKVNLTEDAIATDSVVMYVDNISNANSINLYPLVIDLNTIHRENGAKICFFYQNPVQDNTLEFISLDDFSINPLYNNKIKQKVENLGDLFSSSEDISTYNTDRVLDAFDKLQSCLSGEVYVDFGDL